eukprot:Clim_evm51s147 gene=Clim_evmTU51s147
MSQPMPQDGNGVQGKATATYNSEIPPSYQASEQMQANGFQLLYTADHSEGWYEIYGTDSQLLELIVAPGKKVKTEPGNMIHMDDGLSPDLETGGCGQACTRCCCGGESFFRVQYKNKTDKPLRIGLTPEFPGAKVVPVTLDEYNGGLVLNSGAYMSSLAENLSFSLKFAGMKAGCCGGQGFILTYITGSGLVFLNAGGTVIRKNLAEGEVLLVDTGSVVAFDKNIHYTVRRVGGLALMCCGGEGLFNTKFVGPGTVWLQSMSFSRAKRALRGPGGGGSNNQTDSGSGVQ